MTKSKKSSTKRSVKSKNIGNEVSKQKVISIYLIFSDKQIHLSHTNVNFSVNCVKKTLEHQVRSENMNNKTNDHQSRPKTGVKI